MPARKAKPRRADFSNLLKTRIDTRAEAQIFANSFRTMALTLEGDAAHFDDSGTQCECCERVTYNDWGQREVKLRILGAAERLREIASTIERRLMPTLEE